MPGSIHYPGAGRHRKAIEIDGASHAIMVSHPHEVAALIEEAATAE